MKVWRYVWQVVAGCLQVIIVIAAFEATNYSESTDVFKIILALLFVIITQISATVRAVVIDQMDSRAVMYLELREIKKKLDITVEDEDEVKDAVKIKEDTKKKTIFPSIFDSIIWAIAGLYLLGAVI